VSEANYPEVQLQHKFSEWEWLAQTFIPLTTHEMEYISLKLEPLLYVVYVEIAIQYTLAGVPTGVDLAADRIHWVTLDKHPRNKTILFRFRPPFRLIAGVEYAIILRLPEVPAGRFVWATYEAPPGHYPRGKMIKSDNKGVDWDTTSLGDLFFAEWGNPPLEPIKHPPPLQNFAVLDSRYFTFDLGVIIRIPTNVPCHLTCYWTGKTPLKHHTTRVIRGLTVPWQTYFCFVGWHAVEQQEYGCTLYHTFHLPDWQVGETRWFTFRGTVDLVDSPSVGPIFKQTNPGQTLIANPSFEVFTSPPGPPDQWLGAGSPGYPAEFQPCLTDKTHGLQSCQTIVNHLFAIASLYQNLDPSELSDLQLSFRVAFKGEIQWRSFLRIRAWGDVLRIVYARPTLNYQWEDLTATITMPSNLYRLEFMCRIDNQGQPVPWSALWDDCRVYLGTPP